MGKIKMVTRLNGTVVFLPKSISFLIHATAVLRNGIWNFILSSTVAHRNCSNKYNFQKIRL